MKKTYFFTLLLILSGLLSVFSQSEEKITFVISINPEFFSKNSSIKVNLYDSKEIKIAEETASCMASYDIKTRKEEIKCPDGINYRRVKPEEFNFNLNNNIKKIEIESESISVGEKYRLHISGLSNDNCNRMSAQIEAIAKTNKVILKDLRWSQTEMACP